MGDKLVKGKKFYKIRWQNFSANDDTWEPEENLLPNPNLAKTIETYWKEKKQKQEERKRRSASKTENKKEVWHFLFYLYISYGYMQLINIYLL